MNWFKKTFFRNWKTIWTIECTAPYERSTLGFITDSGRLSGAVYLQVDETRGIYKIYAKYGDVYGPNFDLPEIISMLDCYGRFELKEILNRYSIKY